MWKIIAVITVVLTAGLFVTITVLERQLASVSGHNTVSLQLVSDRAGAERILVSWNAPLRGLAETNLAVDFAFMFLGYGLLFFAVSRLLDSSILSFFSFLPVVFDSTENIMHLSAIVLNQPDMITASCLLTVLKFVFIGVYLLLLLTALVLRLARKRNENA